MSLETLRLESDRRLVTWLMAGVLLPILWFAGLDLLAPAQGVAPLGSRMASRAASLAVPLAGLWMVRRARTREAFSWVLFIVPLAAVPALVGLLWQRPYGSMMPLAPMIMVLVVMYGGFSNTPWRQSAPPLLLSAGLVWMRVAWLNADTASDMWSDLIVMAFVNVMGVAIVRRRAELQRQVSDLWTREHEARAQAESALRELHTLRGIIPICSHCRQVRTGAGEWQQIEQYVHEHSATQFSHGICPACARTRYADYLPGAT